MGNASVVNSILALVERLDHHAREQHARLHTEGQAAREAADPRRSAAHWRAAAVAAMESNRSREVAATLARQVHAIRKKAA